MNRSNYWAAKQMMDEKLPLALNPVEIKPIKQHQVEDVKRVILTVGSKLYRWDAPLEEISKEFDKQPIVETRIDAHFFVWVLILVISILLFVGSACKTLSTRRSG